MSEQPGNSYPKRSLLAVIFVELVIIALLAVNLISNPGSVAVPNSVAKADINAGYCDYNAAMAVIDRLDELTKAEQGTQTPNAGNITKMTDEQRAKIYSAFPEMIGKIDSLAVPDCLKLSVAYLRASYVDMQTMFDGSKDRKPEDVFGLLASISQNQKLFREEYARVKACVPTGCIEK